MTKLLVADTVLRFCLRSEYLLVSYGVLASALVLCFAHCNRATVNK